MRAHVLDIAEADAGVLAYMNHFRFPLRLAQGRANLMPLRGDIAALRSIEPGAEPKGSALSRSGYRYRGRSLISFACTSFPRSVQESVDCRSHMIDGASTLYPPFDRYRSFYSQNMDELREIRYKIGISTGS